MLEGVAALQQDAELDDALRTLAQLVQWAGLSWDEDALHVVRLALGRS